MASQNSGCKCTLGVCSRYFSFGINGMIDRDFIQARV